MFIGRGPVGHIVHLAGESVGQPLPRKRPIPGGVTAGVAPARSNPSRRASSFNAAVRASGDMAILCHQLSKGR